MIIAVPVSWQVGNTPLAAISSFSGTAAPRTYRFRWLRDHGELRRLAAGVLAEHEGGIVEGLLGQ
jgi:hypothetical protein